MILVEEVLATWREAERVLDDITPESRSRVGAPDVRRC